MTDTKKLRSIRIKLWCNDSACHWCGRETILNYKEGGGWLDEDEATVDHMFVRGTKERGTSQQELVLACYKCNNLRGRVSEFYNTAIVNLQAGIPIHKVVKNLDKALKDFEERIGKKEHGFNREF